MSALFIESFDHYLTTSELSLGSMTVAGAPIFEAGRFSRGQKLVLPTVTDTVSIPFADSSDAYLGFSFSIGTFDYVGATLFSLIESGEPATNIDVKVSSAGILQVYSGATLLGAASNGALVVGRDYFVELYCAINGTTGAWTLKVDGVDVTSGTSVDTQVSIAALVNELLLQGSVDLRPTFDDLYIADSTGSPPYNGFVGAFEILTRRPNGDGYVNDWLPTGAGTTNADRVDDPLGNDGDTTYLNPTLVTDTDSWTYENITDVITGGVDNIHSVQYKTCARGDSGTYRVRVRSVATDALSAAFTYSATYAYSRAVVAVDPNTSVAWVSANWDSAEAGVELVSL